ncbi:hypothetical protein TrispH2_010106 [Trichoplax sp. H2]|nr:hypothetical protein TrispH2_010106 [Trichoplax sp. H2]|eukprot:RDD39060.1 hypothetical protein TrispH2_010106 [Trichoplax sp. H2]
MAQSNSFIKYCLSILMLLIVVIFCVHVLSIASRINQYTLITNCTYINGSLVSQPYRGAVVFADAWNPSTNVRVITKILHPNSPYTIVSDYRLSTYLSRWKSSKTLNCYVDLASSAVVKAGAADRMPIAFYIIILIPFSFLLLLTVAVICYKIRRSLKPDKSSAVQSNVTSM